MVAQACYKTETPDTIPQRKKEDKLTYKCGQKSTFIQSTKLVSALISRGPTIISLELDELYKGS